MAQKFMPFLNKYFPITGDYGGRTAKGPNAGGVHNAVDFGTPAGTPLYSMGRGTVLAPNGNPEGVTGGKTVTVDYGDGIIVSFSHLSEIFVQEGDTVGAGQYIGETGATGIVTAAHLHVDAWQNGSKINVADLLDFDADDVPDDVWGKQPGQPGALGTGGGPLDAVGDAIGGVGDVAASVGDFVSAVLNPENWARIAAMFLGLIMAGAGTFMLWQAT